jgi:hypothetical protein
LLKMRSLTSIAGMPGHLCDPEQRANSRRLVSLSQMMMAAAGSGDALAEDAWDRVARHGPARYALARRGRVVEVGLAGVLDDVEQRTGRVPDARVDLGRPLLLPFQRRRAAAAPCGGGRGSGRSLLGRPRAGRISWPQGGLDDHVAREMGRGCRSSALVEERKRVVIDEPVPRLSWAG